MTETALSRPAASEAEPNAVDHVYHITTTDRLASLKDGLQPFPERGREPAWRKVEAFLDDHRPPEVVDRGITRRESVFAHPDFAVFGQPGVMGTHQPLETADSRHVALRVAVNPDEVIVCDVGALFRMREAFTHQPFVQQTAERCAREYWGSSMTLNDFRQHYEMSDTPFGVSYERREGAPEHLPFAMLEPEVLIPQGVTPDNLSLVASSVRQ